MTGSLAHNYKPEGGKVFRKYEKYLDFIEATGEVEIQFDTVLGKQYRLQSSVDYTNWTEVAGVTEVSPGVFRFAKPGERVVYRVQLVEP